MTSADAASKPLDVLGKAVCALALDQGGIADMDVRDVRKLQGGTSSEIWALEARWSENGAPVERSLILRSGMANEFALTGRGAEFDVMRALEGSDLPVPRVYWFDAAGRHFDRPAMVMDRCSGKDDRNLLGERNRLGLCLEDRVGLGRQMIDLLARLHGRDATSITTTGDGADDFSAAAQLAQHDAAIARLETEPSVELRFASWWLWRNLPPAPARLSIVHGDYRPANMLVEDKQICAMLDWEFGHPGDPLEDLGWFLTPYYTAEHLITGSFGHEDAIARYEAGRGQAVDRAALRFWAVVAMYKLAYMTTGALRWLVEGDPARLAVSAEFIVGPLLAAIAQPGEIGVSAA